MKCKICGLGPQDGITVYRDSPKGDPNNKWVCRKCGGSTDPETEEIIKIIEQC